VSPSARSRSLRVLIACADAPLREHLGAQLRACDHRAELRADAESAGRCALPDVLVADLALPGAGGFELLEQLGASGVPGLLLAGMPSADDWRRALQLGARDLLVKPVRASEFVLAVERAAEPFESEPVPSGLRGSYPASARGVQAAVSALAAFALRRGIGPTPRVRIASACCEILDNARRHAYPSAPGALHVDAQVRAGELCVRVRDEGCGFAAERALLELGRGAGHGRSAGEARGLARVAALAERMRIESGARGTSVELSFDLTPSLFEEERELALTELDWLDPVTARSALRAIRRGDAQSACELSPAIAATLGRLLAGRNQGQQQNAALWS
jgi:CheY-like chemotaxis protein/anti-sigma regulatory factor (Ser/Thr protein kinase)